ncbi:hypothetical protein BC567DRAFT_298559 [Phyllosticta citribraziliensis]
MAPISDFDVFTTIAEGMLRTIEEGMAMKQREMARLNEVFSQLYTKNGILEDNLRSRRPTITPEILDILKQLPMTGLITPIVAFFEWMMPQLAKFEIFFEDDFGEDERFKRVMDGWAILQRDQGDCDAEINNVVSLAQQHYGLRLRHIAMATGDLRERLQRINGRGPDPPEEFSDPLPDFTHIERVQLSSSGPASTVLNLT